MYLPPATELLVPNPTTASVQLISGRGLYMGQRLAETTGTAGANVEIVDGATGSTSFLDVVNLAANESARDWYGGGGSLVQSGISLRVLSGSVKGCVLVIPETLLPDDFLVQLGWV